jgi:hypothetical protein
MIVHRGRGPVKEPRPHPATPFRKRRNAIRTRMIVLTAMVLFLIAGCAKDDSITKAEKKQQSLD